ncbi:hypothetical protein [Cupriavidus campinensis]|uniref:hypothetical protein n=1 Tax=Cupriavidus campinensis TaxID=151783 RepID=UPI0037093F5B
MRPVYREGLSALIDKWLSTAPAGLPEAEARRQALVEVSAMAGALMLARATAGDPLSEAILDATRAWLLGADAVESAPEPSPPAEATRTPFLHTPLTKPPCLRKPFPAGWTGAASTTRGSLPPSPSA